MTKSGKIGNLNRCLFFLIDTILKWQQIKKQFKIVAELLKKANTIIVATDSDREGENIAWSIIHKANAFSKDKIFKRLWINSLEKM